MEAEDALPAKMKTWGTGDSFFRSAALRSFKVKYLQMIAKMFICSVGSERRGSRNRSQPDEVRTKQFKREKGRTSLVEMDPLDLSDEQSVGGDLDSQLAPDQLGQPLLVPVLDGGPLGSERLLVSGGHDAFEEVEVFQPAVGAEGRGEEGGEFDVALVKPSSGGDSVCERKKECWSDIMVPDEARIK